MDELIPMQPFTDVVEYPPYWVKSPATVQPIRDLGEESKGELYVATQNLRG